jgi:hypothetical protein
VQTLACQYLGLARNTLYFIATRRYVDTITCTQRSEICAGALEGRESFKHNPREKDQKVERVEESLERKGVRG